MDTECAYDLAVAWNWEYDREFIALIGQAAVQNGVSFLEVRKDNIAAVTGECLNGKTFIRNYLDRASDEDEAFQPLSKDILAKFRTNDPSASRPINPGDHLQHATDKATMHLEFLAHGLEVPYTLIISPYAHKSELELSLTELAKLGRPFIIKPANTTGGGIGVVMGAETLKEVIDARQAHKNDKYLLQETIRPAVLKNRRAWFRVFSVFGEIIPCWWDDQTHLYEPLTEDDERQLGLGRLKEITRRIGGVCQLDFFSSELVFTEKRRFISVDYVNEMCDMRLQSIHPDGVPDETVRRIVARIVAFAGKGKIRREPVAG